VAQVVGAYKIWARHIFSDDEFTTEIDYKYSMLSMLESKIQSDSIRFDSIRFDSILVTYLGIPIRFDSILVTYLGISYLLGAADSFFILPSSLLSQSEERFASTKQTL